MFESEDPILRILAPRVPEDRLSLTKAALAALSTSLPGVTQESNPKPYRDRAEMFAMKDGKIFGGLADAGNFLTFGGGIDPGEDPATAAVREFAEESGYHVHNPRPLPFDPHELDWSPPYSGKKQAERAKTYRGSRTHYFVGDLGEPHGNKLVEPVSRKGVGLYDIDEAMAMSKQDGLSPTLVAANAKRMEVLKHLKGLPPALKHILVTGFSGAGKTTYAKKLSGENKMPHVSLDAHPLWKQWKGMEVSHLDPEEKNAMRRLNNRKLVEDAIRKAKVPSIIEGVQLMHGDPELLKAHERHLIDTPLDRLVEQRLTRDRSSSKYNPKAMGLDELEWRKQRVAKAKVGTQIYKAYLPRWRSDPSVKVINHYADKTAADYKERRFSVAVDLDGTLAEEKQPHDPDFIGLPRRGAKKWMKLLHEAGVRIIIFTVRNNPKLIETWMEEHGIPFDHINENPDQPPGSSGKVMADVYWDNRAFNGVRLGEFGPSILSTARRHKKQKVQGQGSSE